MTTQTINNIADLARILREQPEWADAIRGIVLGEDALNLPALFDEFVRVTDENNRLVREELAQQRELLAQHGELLAQHSAQLAQHTEQLARITELLAQHGEELAQQRELLAQHGEQLARTNELLAQHGEQLAQHTEQLARTNELLALFRADLNSFEARMNRMEGRLGNLEGREYERGVRTKALSRVRHRMKMGRVYLALTQDGLVAPQLNSVIARALERGDLSEEDEDDLLTADIIISDHDNRHAVIEVSITAEEVDIVRARRRADIMAAVTGGVVKPAVITASLNEVQKAQAVEAAVSTFIVPYP